ncbi:MAG: penicillin acylase family protein, partial [Halieaceae bacterium]
GYQNRGSENNVFVATGEGIEARDVIPGGQGGHRLSSGVPGAHFDDQFDLYQQFKYKPVPFEREDIETLAVSQTVIPLE